MPLPTFSPDPDWLFLPSAPLTIATGDAGNRWTFLNVLRYRLDRFKPRDKYSAHNHVLSTFVLSGFQIDVLEDVSRFWVTYEEYHNVDAHFWDFARLARTQHLSIFPEDPNVLEGISLIWFTAVAIADMHLAKGNWNIMARTQGLTSPLVLIPRDIWMHFEIIDWARGIARASTGETLHSIHLAPADNYAPCQDPEAFRIAHPDTILVGGELVRNLSLYRLRTAQDHPQDVQWSVQPHEKPQPDQELIAQDDVAQAASDPIKTVGLASAEKACKVHLERQMRASPNTPTSKESCWKDASDLFPGLSRNGFDRAWSLAIQASGSENWQRPGRRKKPWNPDAN